MISKVVLSLMRLRYVKIKHACQNDGTIVLENVCEIYLAVVELSFREVMMLMIRVRIFNTSIFAIKRLILFLKEPLLFNSF